MAQRINIKGIREGLLITVNAGTTTAAPDAATYDRLLQALRAELESKKDFLQGSRVALAVGAWALSRRQLAGLQELMAGQGLELWAVLTDTAATKEAARRLGLGTRLSGSNTDLEGNMLTAVSDTAVNALGSSSAEGTPGARGLLLKETLRSGRSIFHEGHVVVIGDVNPGAEIVAGGDVVVWGKLRGLVHAGAMGDTTAVICALELSPTQLRIADQIAISPDERRLRTVPEMAAIRAGRIVAEAWPIGDRAAK